MRLIDATGVSRNEDALVWPGPRPEGLEDLAAIEEHCGKVRGGTVGTLAEAAAAIRDPEHWAVTFAIQLRRGLVAADVDLDGWRGDAARDALAAWCDREGIRYVITASGRPGHGHVIARCGSRVDEFATQAAALGITGQLRRGKALLRPPGAPSRHPGCPAASLVYPATPAEAIAALDLDTLAHEPAPAPLRSPRSPKQRPARTPVAASTPGTGRTRPRPGPKRPLPPNVQALVTDGTPREPREKYPRDVREGTNDLDRSHVLWVLAVHAVLANWTEAEYQAAALDPANKGCAKVADLRDEDRYLTTQWALATKWVTEHAEDWAPAAAERSRADLLARLVFARAHVLAWAAESVSPELRPGLLATFEANLGVALDAGSADGFGVSVRRLTELAGHAKHDRAWEHQRTLAAARHLTVVQHFCEDGTQTNRYALPLAAAGAPACPPGCGGCALLGTPGAGGVITSSAPNRNHPLLRVPDRSVGHDLWTEGKGRGEDRDARPRGLGKNAWLAYSTLTDAPQDLHTLALATGRVTPGQTLTRQARRTLTALLGTLAEHGLVVQSPEGWARSAADLDEVAQRIGVTGRIAALRAEHIKDREGRRKAAEAKALEARAHTLTAPDPQVPSGVESLLSAEDQAWWNSVVADLYRDETGAEHVEAGVCSECQQPCSLPDLLGGFRHSTCTPGAGDEAAVAMAGTFGPEPRRAVAPQVA